MTRTRPLLSALKAELSKLRIRKAKVLPSRAWPLAKIEAFEKEHGFRLAGELKAYYREMNGHRISWSIPGTDIYARSEVMGLESFFRGRLPGYVNDSFQEEAPFYSKYLDERQKQKLDGYCLFEQLYVDTFVLISRDSVADDPQLFLLEYPDQLTRLRLSFTEYLQKLVEHKALLNWQQQYKEKRKNAALHKKFDADLQYLAGLPAQQGPPAKPSRYHFSKRLDALVQKIKSNKNLELVLVERQRHPLAPINAFKKVEATFKTRLPKALVAFYSELNGFRLIWRTLPGVLPQASGELEILPFEEAFGGEQHPWTIDWDDYVTYEILWDNETPILRPEWFRELKNKRVFDKHLARNQVVMDVSNGGVEFFAYNDGGVTKMDVGFEGLVDELFRSAGVEYYPTFFVHHRSNKQFIRELEEKVKHLG